MGEMQCIDVGFFDDEGAISEAFRVRDSYGNFLMVQTNWNCV
jgi:hypothetical protein